jgi:hypothetical protein
VCISVSLLLLLGIVTTINASMMGDWGVRFSNSFGYSVSVSMVRCSLFVASTPGNLTGRVRVYMIVIMA